MLDSPFDEPSEILKLENLLPNQIFKLIEHLECNKKNVILNKTCEILFHSFEVKALSVSSGFKQIVRNWI